MRHQMHRFGESLRRGSLDEPIQHDNGHLMQSGGRLVRLMNAGPLQVDPLPGEPDSPG
jgi:hypothetical protein